MGIKNIITIVLLVFVLGSAGFMIFGGFSSEKVVESEEAGAKNGMETGDVREGHHVVAYYFYTTKRCPTCIKIEEYTRASIDANFSRLLESGSLEFHAVNVDEAENEKFIEEYQLTTKSVILVDYRDGERVDWKNLEKVWEYTGNREIFVDYVKDETLAYLAELSGV